MVKARRSPDFSIVFYLTVSALIVFALSLFTGNILVFADNQYNWEEVLHSIFQERDNSLLNGNPESLTTMYIQDEQNSHWAYELEIKRAEYLKDWAARQGIQFTNINSNINIKRVRKVGRGYAFYVVVSSEYMYVYENDPDKINFFRIGTYHSLDLIPGNTEGWVISREWYLDPFQDSLNQKAFKNDDEVKQFVLSQSERDFTNISAQRMQAVAYADRYAGAASDGQYGYDYNKKYPNYNQRGGDCSNYVSQILHESGFKASGGWTYGKDAASHLWCNASGLESYLIYSGKASIIAKGTYSQVYKAAYKLVPGDVIAYQEKGDVVHMAFVTGADSKGYPLVNTHTTDRYHVPWDLGWNDSDIKFFLLKVNYPG